MLVSPSILSADFGNLQRVMEMLNSSEADMIHLDIMDELHIFLLRLRLQLDRLPRSLAKL